MHRKIVQGGRVDYPSVRYAKKTLSVRGLTMCNAHKCTKEVRLKMSKVSKLRPKFNMRGDKHWNWKGGIKPLNETIRHSIEYKLWRTAVFERDNYQCIWGGKEHGSKLCADHIKQFAFYPELRFAIDNGRTLCVDCHKTTDTYLLNKKI